MGDEREQGEGGDERLEDERGEWASRWGCSCTTTNKLEGPGVKKGMLLNSPQLAHCPCHSREHLVRGALGTPLRFVTPLDFSLLSIHQSFW